jgi:NAD(P)-dependent dehydrogenase (short-subunit alcohol dehydrogenase family)
VREGWISRTLRSFDRKSGWGSRQYKLTEKRGLTSPSTWRERYGQLDVLINNAGIGPISLDDLRVEDWKT